MKVQVEATATELAQNRDMLTQAVEDLTSEARDCFLDNMEKSSGNSTAWGNHPKACINDLRRIWTEAYNNSVNEMVRKLAFAIDEDMPEDENDPAGITALHLDIDRNKSGKG